ncbi:unnamed protein product [Brassica rapa]|uniref:Uncharacterized protein n=2 Tax=Brassica TaxID=3705 RepID=A0A3P5ZED1_BRACM|nr:unnamed protein product [Brassica napus]CAG7874867.1 unnamed protein product [Brassica rapa]CDY42086.1 BnaA05g11000D [Brassica napus]VDC70578.1 unnamed protein product [Brassica rapa]
MSCDDDTLRCSTIFQSLQTVSSYFKPQEDAQMIAHGLFPMPRLVVCDQHGSQAGKVFVSEAESFSKLQQRE